MTAGMGCDLALAPRAESALDECNGRVRPFVKKRLAALERTPELLDLQWPLGDPWPPNTRKWPMSGRHRAYVQGTKRECHLEVLLFEFFKRSETDFQSSPVALRRAWEGTGGPFTLFTDYLQDERRTVPDRPVNAELGAPEHLAEGDEDKP